MRVSWFSSILVLGFSIAAPVVRAQPAPEVAAAVRFPGFAPGDRLRVRMATGKVYTGHFASADDASLTVGAGNGFVLTVDKDQIAGIELGEPRGRGRGALRGSLKGAAAMLVVGGVLYAADNSMKRPDGLCGDLSTGIQTCTTGSDVAAAALGGAIIGAALGAVFPGEHWVHAKPEALRLGLGPTARGGLAVRASLSF